MLQILLATLLAASALQAASARARPKHRAMVFGEGREWYLFEPGNSSVRSIPVPDNVFVTGVTCSEDGTAVYMTLVGSTSNSSRLVRIDPDKSAEPTEIARISGRMEEPALSEDSNWIYLTVLPDITSEPLNHPMRQFAQIKRLHLPSGSLEDFTTMDGCHLAPSASKGVVAYLHSACVRPSRTLEVTRSTEAQSIKLLGDPSLRDPSLSVSGRRIVYAHILNRSKMAVTELDIASPKKTQIQRVLAVHIEQHPRPQIDLDDATVYFESAHKIWRMSAGSLTEVADLGKAQ